jgi:hypothetical protein
MVLGPGDSHSDRAIFRSDPPEARAAAADAYHTGDGCALVIAPGALLFVSSLFMKKESFSLMEMCREV